jgi:ribose-phosphate pyrophosphokinase
VRLLYFDDERAFARRLAAAARIEASAIHRHRFPDGEVKLTLPRRLPRAVVLLRSLHEPNEKLIEMWLAARTARTLGAVTVTLVAPYLAYMRQDRAFAPGEAISQRHIGALLAALFDRAIAVDPHLHRISSLADILPATVAVTVSAAPAIGDFLRRRAAGALLVGPDEESAQWVRTAAETASLEWAVARKVRSGDRRVAVAIPDVDVRDRRVVLVDDMISTGRTLAEAARKLRHAGATRVDVAATHALFAEHAARVLEAAGVRSIWTTDSVRHPTNAIRLARLLADALAHSGSSPRPVGATATGAKGSGRYRTISTGHFAVRITVRVVEPNTSRSTAPRPRTPITMRSEARASDCFTISRWARPVNDARLHAAVRPRLVGNESLETPGRCLTRRRGELCGPKVLGCASDRRRQFHDVRKREPGVGRERQTECRGHAVQRRGRFPTPMPSAPARATSWRSPPVY